MLIKNMSREIYLNSQNIIIIDEISHKHAEKFNEIKKNYLAKTKYMNKAKILIIHLI